MRLALALSAAACTAPPLARPVPADSGTVAAADGSDGTGEGTDGTDGSTDGADGTGDGADGTEAPWEPVLQGLLIAQSWDQRDAPTAAGAGAGHYGVIVLQESMYTLLPEVRAANPGATILAYQKVGGMRADGGDHASTGLRTDQAEESWYLHDTDGDRLRYCDYTEVWAADIGDAGYQAAWLEAVRERLTRDGFDGVMMDDVNLFPGHCLGERGGTPLAEYATDAAYGEAVVDFMQAVGPELRAAGLLVAPNIAMNPWEELHLDQATRILPGVSHWLREYWMRWDDSANFVTGNWTATMETMAVAQAAGVSYLALTLGPGEEGVTAGQQYGRASFLMAWDGESDSHWGYLDATRVGDPWAEAWGPDVGRPVEDAHAVGHGWQRSYEGGVVVVHPSDAGPQAFTFDAPVRSPEGALLTEITLESGEGLVLAWE